MLLKNSVVRAREFKGEDIKILRITEECGKIQRLAFADCKSLTCVYVERSDKPIAIELSAFTGCESLVIFETDRPIRFFTDFYARRMERNGNTGNSNQTN